MSALVRGHIRRIGGHIRHYGGHIGHFDFSLKDIAIHIENKPALIPGIFSQSVIVCCLQKWHLAVAKLYRSIHYGAEKDNTNLRVIE